MPLFEKGHLGWNKGLTKETDPRVAKSALSLRKTISSIGSWQTRLSSKDRALWVSRIIKSNTGRSHSVSKVARDKISKANKARLGTTEHRKQQSEMMRKMWRNKKYKQNHKKARLKRMSEGRYRCSEESRQLRRELHKLRKIGNYKPHSEETKKKIGRANKINTRRSWQNPEYVKKQMKARGVRPNMQEMKLQSFLNKYFPNEWLYVGDGELVIGGKVPDFMNVNGKKWLIELYGDYHHQGQNPQDRIDFFSRYGYKTLVIWERELKMGEGELLQYIQAYWRP